MEGATALPDESVNPWLDMWTRPRRTMRWVVENQPRRFVVPLAAAAGIGEMLDRCAARNAGDSLPLSAILALGLLGGPLAGVFQLYVGGWLVGLTGRWLGGRAGAEQVRAAFAWASLPVIAGSVLWVPELALAGREMFTVATPGLEAAPGRALAVVGMSGVEAVLGAWAFVLMLKGLGEVQGFSAWKALGNMALAAVVVVAPIAVIGAVLSVAVPNLLR